jgi:membrane associated rhomboid family serine protease
MTPWVRWLLVANIGFFVLQLTVPIVTGLMAFIPAYILVRPWTLVTYMFAHDPNGFSHILFNMLGLLIFGARVEDRLGSSHFIRLYLVSGVTGAMLSFFTPFAAIIGASGAVFGVQLAFARFWPRERIYIWGVIPVEARVLVVLMTILALYGGARGGGGVAHFAHLGGYLGAWLYLVLMERYSPARRWKEKVAAPPKGMESVGDWSRIDLTGIHAINREEVERLIAKIKADGERSLSTQERVFLSHFIPRSG